jgi:transposase
MDKSQFRHPRLDPPLTRAIWKDLLTDVMAREAIDLSSVCYDGTNFYTFIDTFNGRCNIAKRGKNKQGRANLRQVSYALFCQADTQVPLYYEVYEGNRHDTKQFPVMIEHFQQFLTDAFGATTQGPQLTLIFDKGNNSKGNFGLIDTLKLHYVGSIKLSEVKEWAEISNQHGPWTSCQTLGLEKTKGLSKIKLAHFCGILLGNPSWRNRHGTHGLAQVAVH